MEDPSQVAKALFKEINAMPYYKNYAAASGMVHNVSKHEDAVKDILLKNGFKEWEVPEKGKKKKTKKRGDDESDDDTEEEEETAKTRLVKNWITSPPLATDMPSMTYISQPCGKNSNPDFLVKIKPGVVFAIECKSSSKKTKKPLYNSGGLKHNYIYIYSSYSTNSTTIYMGSDILTAEQQKLIDEHIVAQRKMDLILNEQLKKLDTTHRGVSYYTRPMIGQSGDSTYTDYFKHETKSLCEENVVKFIEHMINSS